MFLFAKNFPPYKGEKHFIEQRQNKCLSFDGSDGRRYQNELCFDDKALALKDLKKYATNKKTALDKEEQKLLELWNKIIYEAKKTNII